MADEILSVLQTLYNHRQLVRDACVDFDGTIPENEDTEAAVRALKKQGLVWKMGELESISLSRPLLHLLRSAIQRRDRRLASGNVDRLWEDVCERINDYSTLMKSGKTSDLEFIETDIGDGLHELADTIRNDIRSYADYLDHGFAYVRDPELRIKQNERAIQRAKSLNDYLGGINVHQVVAVSHLNSRLRNLLQAGFAVAIRYARQELVNTVHRLNELLVTLRRDGELNKLLRIFELKFKNDAAFQVTLPEPLEHIPPTLDIAGCLIRPEKEAPADSSWKSLWGDIYSAGQAEDLANIVQKLRPFDKHQLESGPVTSGSVEDTRQQTSVAEQDHPAVEAARSLVQAMQKIDGAISLVDSHKKLNIDCRPSLWLTTVINIVEALPEKQRLNYKLHYIEVAHPTFSGNHWVEDIRLEYCM